MTIVKRYAYRFVWALSIGIGFPFMMVGVVSTDVMKWAEDKLVQLGNTGA